MKTDSTEKYSMNRSQRQGDGKTQKGRGKEKISIEEHGRTPWWK